jgi:hypothetical protein
VVDPDWIRSVAVILDAADVARGTAFFVGDDVAMTCEHVLAAAGEGEVRLRRYGAGETETVLDSDADAALDLALVRVAPKPDVRRLVVGTDTPQPGLPVVSHGFPRDHPIAKFPSGIPLDTAKVTGPTIINWRGRQVDQLTLFGSGFKEGFSGAPAVDDDSGEVVGVLTKLESNERAYAIPAQVARLRWPELPTADANAGFADITRVHDAVAPLGWSAFDPARLHCLVVACDRDPGQELSALLTEAMSRPEAAAVWDAFRASVDGRALVSGDVRDVADEYAMEHIRQAAFRVTDAFASFESLATATRLLVEADLALFDVTGFEPGVMLLAGIRAATRRGVTIASHGAGWHEGEPLDRPFNLWDLSLASHAASDHPQVGPDPRVDALAGRICRGFEALALRPSYLDLPVYDALRRLGSHEGAWASVGLDEEVLVLCSYHASYFGIWQELRRNVAHALADAKNPTRRVARLADAPTPQLVSQTLYERIRRCAACVADWTFSSPSTFFEIGVRLAANPSGAVQVAERGWLEAPTGPHGDAIAGVAKQVAAMRNLFDPLVYDKTPEASIACRVAAQLIGIREQVEGRSLHPIRTAAAEALARVEAELADPAEVLCEQADTLKKLDTSTSASQALFYEAAPIKLQHEEAARERRVAAWMYLHHRAHAGDLPDEDPRKKRWRELGTSVVGELYGSDRDADVELAHDIEEMLA